MKEIVFTETRPGVMEPRKERLTRPISLANNSDAIERWLDLILAAVLWGVAAWAIHQFLSFNFGT